MLKLTKSFLVDVNVWVALASNRHAHHAGAHHWFDTVDAEAALFCRFTQLSFLRLLTNIHVMGVDIRSQIQAWQAYDQLREDFRVGFTSEPSDFEIAFRRFTQASHPAIKFWADAYLAALARTRGLTVVSFDGIFSRIDGIESVVLPTK